MKKEPITIAFNFSIFDPNIAELLKEEIKSKNIKSDYKYKYDLEINFSNFDLTNENIKRLISSKKIFEYIPNFKDKIVEALRLEMNMIIEEFSFFYLDKITATGKNRKDKTMEIKLIKKEKIDYELDYPESENKKIKLKASIPSTNEDIDQIIDNLPYEEWNVFVDTKNRNKTRYNELLNKKEQGIKININDLKLEDWQQLILKENVTNNNLAELYDLSLNEVKKIRKKYLPNIKEYMDEYLFFDQMLSNLSDNILYSNFCLINLEKAKNTGVKTIYEYAPLKYKELFSIDYEIKRQKEIEKNNLKGEKYVMPLTGIMLKKFYEMIKAKYMDRKILKSNYYLTYYSSEFFEGIIKRIEKTNIIAFYESGYIYKHPKFKPYETMYKENKLELEEESNIPKLLESEYSESYIPKKRGSRISKPKDYIEIEKTKIKNGETGQELAYNFEVDKLKKYPELQKRIEKTYLINEHAGYDLKSFDEYGKEILIEVKSSASSSLNHMKFKISLKEDQILNTHKNAYIYYLFDKRNPKLRIINQETYLTFNKNIAGYEINQKIK